MKNYPHIISKLFYEPLVVTPRQHASICQVVERHIHKVESGEGDEEVEKAQYVETGKTAIIPVHGTIVRHETDIPMSACGCGLDTLNSMIDTAENDSEISTVIFDFRTPGGSVNGIPETGRKIASMRKATIAYTESECCSGGVWLATQCQKFYAAESADVGSIGVWCAFMDLSRAMQNDGMNMQAISAGKYKLLGAYWKPMTDDEKASVQASVDKIYSQFKAAVNTRREVDPKYMEGQIFDGVEAAQIGLTDGIVDDISELLDSDEQEDD